MLTREINLLTMQQEISSAAQGEMNKSQREYFLRQQLKAIQSELGEGEELAEEVENYRKKIEEKMIPTEAMIVLRQSCMKRKTVKATSSAPRIRCILTSSYEALMKRD